MNLVNAINQDLTGEADKILGELFEKAEKEAEKKAEKEAEKPKKLRIRNRRH